MSHTLDYSVLAAGITLRIHVDLSTGAARIRNMGDETHVMLAPQERTALQALIAPLRGARDIHVRHQFANGSEEAVLVDGPAATRWLFETDGACGEPTMVALRDWGSRMVERGRR